MRWLVTGVAGVAFLVVPPTLAPTPVPIALAYAGTIVNEYGKFSFWVPNDWKMRKDLGGGTERSTYESPDGNVSVLISPLADRSADLEDEDLMEFIDEEIDGMKLTSDKRDKLEKYEIRLLEGTGFDEGDAVIFKAIALDPGTSNGVIEALVYGDPDEMRKAEIAAIVERILLSLRPQ